MRSLNWVCPFCGHAQTITQPKIAVSRGNLKVGSNALTEKLGFQLTAIGCSNSDCEKVQIDLALGEYWQPSNSLSSNPLFQNIFLESRILPENNSKPQPDYIPKVIVADYVEACRIQKLSPKASATLSRRCLQGIIRDFCGISRNRLFDEITALREAVDSGRAPAGVTSDTVDAIDHVREIGNIGAHMEKDINVIVDVEPDEAMHLIGLIESLFDEWYVARERRAQRFRVLGEIAEAKKSAKQGAVAELAVLSELKGTDS